MCVFGVVVAWSIYISGKKAFQLRREENARELADKGEYMEMPETDAEGMETAAVNDEDKGSQKSAENTAAPVTACTHDYKGLTENIVHAEGEEHGEN